MITVRPTETTTASLLMLRNDWFFVNVIYEIRMASNWYYKNFRTFRLAFTLPDKKRSGKVYRIHYYSIIGISRVPLRYCNYYKNTMSKTFVYSSSSTVYREPEVLPIQINRRIRLVVLNYSSKRYYGPVMLHNLRLGILWYCLLQSHWWTYLWTNWRGSIEHT